METRWFQKLKFWEIIWKQYRSERHQYYFCDLVTQLGLLNDSRVAGSVIEDVIEMNSSMNLILEMSWNNVGRFCFLPKSLRSFERVSWRGQELYERVNSTFAGTMFISLNSKRDCHKMFKGTFLPDFYVISETKIIILVRLLIIIRPDSCYQAIFIPLQMEL